MKEMEGSGYISSFWPGQGWEFGLQRDTEIVPAFPGCFCVKNPFAKGRLLFIDTKPSEAYGTATAADTGRGRGLFLHEM